MSILIENYVVVGGGIAGILSALILATRGHQVTLIESSNELGGLLSSRERNGYGWFDNGTHILSETGNAEIDSLLFKKCYTNDWLQHEHDSTCSYYLGEISNQKFFDARLLPDHVYENGFNELLTLPENYGPFSNLEERIKATFGNVFAEHIFTPFMQKFTGLTLAELANNAHSFIGLKRIICSGAEESRRLKSKSKWNDNRLAFHDPEEDVQHTVYFYPKKHGIGLWSESVNARLRDLGVTVLTNTNIKTIDIENNQVTKVILNNDVIIDCNKLVWSAPVVFLLKAAGLYNQILEAPSLCKVLLIDMVIDQPLQFDGFYLTCHEPHLKIFRITNYFALQNKWKDSDQYRLTVEIIVPPNSKIDNVSEDILLKEMKEMNVVTHDTKILKSWFVNINHGFPLPTPDFQQKNESLANEANSSISNLILVGRSAGRTFFMNDVINEVAELLS